MAHASRWWPCVLGHRWEWIDSQPYELGRGYEIAYDYEGCARCGVVRRRDGSLLLPRPPRTFPLVRLGRD